MHARTLLLLAGFTFSIPGVCAENPATARERPPPGADKPADAAARRAPAGEKPPAAPAIRKSRIRQAFPPSTKRM
jgi:hypothetical protein